MYNIWRRASAIPTYVILSSSSNGNHIWLTCNIIITRVTFSLHKKSSFPLRISSVNVTKSAVSWGSGHIYWRNPEWKTYFLCSVYTACLLLMGENLSQIMFYIIYIYMIYIDTTQANNSRKDGKDKNAFLI